jgi:hypothetical protein
VAPSEERQKLKRNASENLKPLQSKGVELTVGGERLRDKNSHDYLETIRENEQLLLNGKSRQKKNLIKYAESDDSYEQPHHKIIQYDVMSEGRKDNK